MRLGILGGTFDPIHQGHLFLAKTAAEQYALDKVLFVPALIPPHKTAKRDMTPAPYRYRMVELALKNQPGFEVSDVEFNRPDISYTVETLRLLKKKYPQDDFFLILGADSAADISRWKEPVEIQKMAVVLAAGRPGVSQEPPSGFPVQRIAMKLCGISSTDIRQRIASGKKAEAGSLPQEVEDYIYKMNLYPKTKL